MKYNLIPQTRVHFSCELIGDYASGANEHNYVCEFLLRYFSYRALMWGESGILVQKAFLAVSTGSISEVKSISRPFSNLFD